LSTGPLNYTGSASIDVIDTIDKIYIGGNGSVGIVCNCSLEQFNLYYNEPPIPLTGFSDEDVYNLATGDISTFIIKLDLFFNYVSLLDFVFWYVFGESDTNVNILDTSGNGNHAIGIYFSLIEMVKVMNRIQYDNLSK